MEKQQRLDQSLQDADQVIASPEMTQLMKQHEFHLIRREASQDRRRKQYRRTKNAHGHRNGNGLATSNEDVSPNAELPSQLTRCFENRLRNRRGLAS